MENSSARPPDHFEKTADNFSHATFGVREIRIAGVTLSSAASASLWREWRGCRLTLHRIHPCAPEDALFHPHPWPSAMRIHEGTYEMGVGWGKGESTPKVAARIIVSGPMEYEMTDPDAWHYVRPIGGPAMTVMLSGAPWARWSPRSDKPLSPLSPAEHEQLLAYFRRVYPRTCPRS